MAKRRQEPAPALRLEWRSPAELAENPANWRRHPATQTAALADVIAEVGWAGACLYNEATGRLIDGHARRKVAIEQGCERVPVLVGSWTEEQEKKILVTLDPLGAMAEADGAALAALLADVRTQSEPLQALLDGLKGSLPAAEVTPGAGGDEFDATPEQGPTRTSVGELWLIGGRHRLLVGDCTAAENVERLMGGERADAVVTDPPYGIDYGRAGGFSATHGWGKWRENVEWDKERPSRAAFDMILRSADVVVVWGGNYFTDYLPPSMCWLVWDKGQRDFSLADCELAWTSQSRAARVFTYSRGVALQDGKEHPTQKPIALVQWCIETIGEPQVIFDPFLGSGTTLIAAHRLGRTCFGCELEPRYADVILKRAEAEGLSCELIR